MDPVITGVGIIGKGGSQTISKGSHTQRIFQGGKSIIHSDVVTPVLTDSGDMKLESDSFRFDPLKVETLMVSPLIEPFLDSYEDVRSTNLIGASRSDQSRIVAPGMNEDISIRNDVQSTVRSDVIEMDKLDAAVQQSSSDKWNAAP